MSRITKALRVVGLSAFILLLVFVIGGLAYTYLGGPENVTQETEEEEETTTYAAPYGEPAVPREDANVSASVQAVTSPVAPGENVSLTVRTLESAECTIVVEYDDVESDDSGLTPKVADEYGMVSWVWTVEADVLEGEWPAEVTCERNGKSAMVRAYIVVEAEAAG